MNKIELLAPAGDLERVKIAVRYGADAVYCGGKEMSLRSAAGNLDLDEIREAVEFSKKYNAKIYLTMNMIPHGSDIHDLKNYLKEIEDIGVSAVIVSSLSLFKLAKENNPKLEVHVSTQQSTINSEAVKFWEDLKADRVILGREVSLEQLKEIKEKTNVPLEVFIHGAMCANYSGRCLLSNDMTNRDANRGGCAQSCRWQYCLNDKLTSFGSKDLNASSLLGEIIQTGVSSLKIEGRMKTAFYLACIIKAYRYLIDSYYSNNLNEETYKEFNEILGSSQNRAQYPGFYLNERSSNSLIRNIQNEKIVQDYIGDIIGYNKEEGLLEVRMRNHLVKGEEVEIISAKSGLISFKTEFFDRDKNGKEVANIPMEVLYFKVDKDCPSEGFIRRKNVSDTGRSHFG